MSAAREPLRPLAGLRGGVRRAAEGPRQDTLGLDDDWWSGQGIFPDLFEDEPLPGLEAASPS